MKIVLNITCCICAFYLNSCDFLSDPGSLKPQYTTVNEINIVNTDGGGHKILAEGWKPQILSGQNLIVYMHMSSIYTVDYDAAAFRLIYNSNSIWDFTASPSGNKIALTLYINNVAGVYVVNYDGTAMRFVGTGLEPDFSPDENKIVLRDNWDIYMTDISGENRKLLQTHPDSSYYRNPYFVPGTEYILYKQGWLNDFSLVALHLFSMNTKADTLLKLYDNNIHYSGYSIHTGLNGIFTYIEGAAGSISDTVKVANMNTLTFRSVGMGYGSSISPDGTKLVYCDNKNVYLCDIDGGNTFLVYTEKDERKYIDLPSISGDNKKIVFQTTYSYVAD